MAQAMRYSLTWTVDTTLRQAQAAASLPCAKTNTARLSAPAKRPQPCCVPTYFKTGINMQQIH